MSEIERESLEVDVLYVGAGPATLASALHLMRSIDRHNAEAAKTGGKTTCHFGYSGLLTEAVLLGNAAYRAGKELAWDTAAGKTNVPAAEQFLGKEYRKGWELPKG